MKKIIVAAFAAIAIVLACWACAEESISIFNGYELPVGVAASVDLDFDGAAETVMWTSEFDEESYMEEIVLTVTNAEGGAVEWVEYLFGAHVYISNNDSDGICEIYMTGDQMSDDYITYCLHYSAGNLTRLLFADAMRGENTGGYYEYGYGMVTDITENALTLCGSQDVLGTYFGSRQFSFVDGAFETCDDGLWYFDIDAADEEMWEYRALNPVQDIPAVFIDDEGQQIESVLKAGERILIYASDTKTIVYFVTEDGAYGYLNIEPDLENWGSMIGGVSEGELFEYVPYAD